MLDAAGAVLAEGGIAEFTVGAVAERAGVSVGTIYLRFSGKDQLLLAVKDQLLGRLESGVGEGLGASGAGLRAVVGAFVAALARTFARHGRIFPELLDAQRAEGRDRGLAALAAIQQAFLDAVGPNLGEVRRPDPSAAVRMAARTVLGAAVHRAATSDYWSDGLSWDEWAAETTEVALAYLAWSGR
ncbi:TetR/AcrR family transcriptional regulator [Amycolatopsis sp. NPDC004368]